MNPLAATIYRHAPVWGQDLLLTGFGALLHRERYGGGYREYRDLLEVSQWWSQAELEAYQDERLRAVVSHAYETVPYYRQLFERLRLTPHDIKGRSDLHKVPLLERDHVRRHFDDLRSRDARGRALRTGHTSGTTGTPLTVGYDRETVWWTYAVFDRHYNWTGCRLGRHGDRIAVARGNVIVPLDQKVPPFWRHNRFHHQLLLSSFHMSRENLPAYLGALRAFGPAVLDGYPSTLYVLAKFLQSRGQRFPVRAAITSSETLYDFQRELIEDRFECAVFDYYALAERIVFSGECDRHQGHHVAMEYGFAEVVDGDGLPVEGGRVGTLVGTSLHNMAMPLIRYATSDMTAIQSTSCPCGRGLAMMDDVTTKAEDMLTLRDGRVISPSVLTHPFKPLDAIEGSQIVQWSPDAVTVRIVAGPRYTTGHTAHLVRELGLRLGEGVRIEVEMVDHLEVSANGKFKWVISHVPLGV